MGTILVLTILGDVLAGDSLMIGLLQEGCTEAEHGQYKKRVLINLDQFMGNPREIAKNCATHCNAIL